MNGRIIIMENSELITKAIGYILRNVSDSSMTIEDVAEHAGFSTDYFNKIFLAHTGANVMEDIRVTRLKKAAIVTVPEQQVMCIPSSRPFTTLRPAFVLGRK